MTIRKENYYMDIIKALGIIAVVIGHTHSPINSFIYLYQMPLFFFISGYFYKESNVEKPFNFIKRRLKSLYIPFVAYEIVFLLFRNIFFSLNVYNDSQLTKITSFSQFFTTIKSIFLLSYGEPMLGTFWFLKTLLYVNILFLSVSLIVSKLKNKEIVRFLIIIVFYVLGSIIDKYNINFINVIKLNHGGNAIRLLLPFVDSKTLILLFSYYVGFIYKKNEHKIIFNKYIFICVFGALIILAEFVHISNSYIHYIFVIISAMLGIYFNLYFGKVLINRNYLKPLVYIGKSSLFIMIFHFLAFKVVNLLQVLFYNYPMNKISDFPTISGDYGWWILYVFAGVFLPTLVKYYWDKIKNIIEAAFRRNSNAIEKQG